MNRALAASTLGLAWFCASCKHDEAAKTVPSASASTARAAVPGASGPAASAVPHLVQMKGGCRALAVSGKATVDGEPITVGTLLDGESWVKLDPSSSVSLRHTQTSRELKLIGPGLVLPCRHGAEQFLLASGSLTTSENLGVRPGAEVLIATPSGIIHYGDAAMDVQFGPKGLRLRVKGGEAWLEPQDPSAPHPKNPLRTQQEAALPPSKLGPAGLADACNSSANTAAESARNLLSPPPGPSAASGPSLGERAATQIRDRAAARAACSTAAAAAGAVTDPAERQILWASIAHSDELWQSVPLAVSAQKN